MVALSCFVLFFFFQAEDGIRDVAVTGVQTCALPISLPGDGGAKAAVADPRTVFTAEPRLHDRPDRPFGPGKRADPPARPAKEICNSRWQALRCRAFGITGHWPGHGLRPDRQEWCGQVHAAAPDQPSGASRQRSEERRV